MRLPEWLAVKTLPDFFDPWDLLIGGKRISRDVVSPQDRHGWAGSPANEASIPPMTVPTTVAPTLPQTGSPLAHT